VSIATFSNGTINFMHKGPRRFKSVFEFCFVIFTS